MIWHHVQRPVVLTKSAISNSFEILKDHLCEGLWWVDCACNANFPGAGSSKQQRKAWSDLPVLKMQRSSKAFGRRAWSDW